MLDTIFAEAVVHRRASRLARWRGLSAHVVLGRTLRPFSFWHAAQLDFIESAYAGHGADFSLGALDLATRVCSLRFPETLAPGAFPRLVACYLQTRYAKHLSRELWAFLSYYRDYASSPLYGEDPEAAGCAFGCPWYAVAVEQLMLVDRHLTLAQAWDAPVGFSRWRIAAHQQATGQRPRVESPEIRAAFAEAGYDA